MQLLSSGGHAARSSHFLTFDEHVSAAAPLARQIGDRMLLRTEDGVTAKTPVRVTSVPPPLCFLLPSLLLWARCSFSSSCVFSLPPLVSFFSFLGAPFFLSSRSPLPSLSSCPLVVCMRVNPSSPSSHSGSSRTATLRSEYCFPPGVLASATCP